MVARSEKEIEILKEGGRMLARVLDLLAKNVEPGLKTIELDRLAEAEIKKSGGEPSFKGYHSKGDPPYPATLCVSINDEVVHGIPGERVINDGDVVSLDLGVKYGGFFTDSALTVIAGKEDGESKKLISVCRRSLDAAIAECRVGASLGDIGHAVESFVSGKGFRVFRELVGHGVGRGVHEDPQIPNWGKPGVGLKLKEGMVLAIEPMITKGRAQIKLAPDRWTWKTRDGSPAAHFEHTILVKQTGAEILTVL
ncbi:MAG: type I methionyl aminopeptidase [Candidatus Niyogibacteria bacterium]|nr:type I methionyl aminopeptidase [Candidatus Niyogibacteria bacterium]